MPAASVIMPCYNAAKFVRQSVAAILRQTFEDLELIVVDDASTDNSVELLRDMASRDARIRLFVHGGNLGVSRSRNDALRAARGEYIAFCDADDVWKPEKLKFQIGLLSRHPSYDLAYCDSEIIDETGAPTGQLFGGQFPPPKNPSGDLFEALTITNFINTQTVLIRRASLGDHLFFDEDIRCGEDWWFWIRFSRNHRFLYETRPLAEYRVHPQNTIFAKKRGFRIDRWKVCKRNLRAHTDMPVRLQALLWYYMGMELSFLGRRRLARKFLGHALRLGLNGGSSLRRLMTISVRWGVECCNGFTLRHQ
jgi:glycosyltransferase involved in cell wall biosynthesis